MSTETIVLLLLVGAAAGIASGMVGIGGGIIIVPALVYVLGFSQAQAQGTSLGLLLLPGGLLAARNYYKRGLIRVPVIGVLAVAFALGGWLGSQWSFTLPPTLLRRLFALLLLVAGLRILIPETGSK